MTEVASFFTARRKFKKFALFSIQRQVSENLSSKVQLVVVFLKVFYLYFSMIQWHFQKCYFSRNFQYTTNSCSVDVQLQYLLKTSKYLLYIINNADAFKLMNCLLVQYYKKVLFKFQQKDFHGNCMHILIQTGNGQWFVVIFGSIYQKCTLNM